MQENYRSVPDILTGKDVDYLCDMFNWNYGALKKANSYLNIVSNISIKEKLEEAISLFNTNLVDVLNILKEGQNENI